MTSHKGQVIGLPILDGGTFQAPSGGGDIQVWFKFHTCVAFTCVRLDSQEYPRVIERTTANGYIVQSCSSTGYYSWVAVGHG